MLGEAKLIGGGSPSGHSDSKFVLDWCISNLSGTATLFTDCAYRKSYSAVFTQCNIVTLRSKLATISIRQGQPIISGLPGPGCTIWPPNHKLVQVATVTAADGWSGPAPSSFSVTGTSNDPGDGQIAITGGPSQFLVQLGADKDQVCTLTATVSDLAGNVATAQATCIVPHDQRK